MSNKAFYWTLAAIIVVAVIIIVYLRKRSNVGVINASGSGINTNTGSGNTNTGTGGGTVTPPPNPAIGKVAYAISNTSGVKVYKSNWSVYKTAQPNEFIGTVVSVDPVGKVGYYGVTGDLFVPKELVVLK